MFLKLKLRLKIILFISCNLVFKFSVFCIQSRVGSSKHVCSCTLFENGVPLCPINLLSANDVAGGVGKINELALGMKVQSSGVHQILDGDHVLIWHLGVHVHTPDDSRATFTIDQEELVFGFWSKTRFSMFVCTIV